MLRANKKIQAWRNKLWWITLSEAVALLRLLGDFNQDSVIIRKRGYRRLSVYDLWQWYSSKDYCNNIWPVYFKGGPFGETDFRGTFLTMVLDRVLLTGHKKGFETVLEIINYVQS